MRIGVVFLIQIDGPRISKNSGAGGDIVPFVAVVFGGGVGGAA
jgi:hypothetical protein